ncbi:hypothetical protein [Intestinibacter bartlettii]|uniref:Haloacid dehalogenase-like hydrolase n=1 Tax=Intestinibacter bartlettii TaxID=261299 RepID=A0ABS6E0K7_9FIRM|nr:hypothetical protein [Intestinibacter bartlettii]MBU5337021.1 hypothetical protein [Intestinibacter bartlettii]MDO5011470.1 hypothetical protein [Intestinibacter bartlettii]
MKGVIFNLNNKLKNIEGYYFMINILKNINIPWVELQNDLIYNLDEIPLDIENCIFISDSQQNLNLAQSLNVKHIIRLNSNQNNLKDKHDIKNLYDLYNKYFNTLFLN